MKLVLGGRQTGKTAKLIEMADGVEGAYIVCRSRDHANEVFKMSKKMDCDINFPITVDEIIHQERAMGSNQKLFFDDLEVLLHHFVPGFPDIEAVSMNVNRIH